MRLHFFITLNQKKKIQKTKRYQQCKVGIFFSMQKSLSEINLSPSLSIISTWEMFPPTNQFCSKWICIVF